MRNLCEAISGLVEERLRDAFETGETINVPDLAITESLADLIVLQRPARRAATTGRSRDVRARPLSSKKSARPA